MRIQVTPADLRSEDARRVQVAQRTYLLARSQLRLADDLAGRSPPALERHLDDGGVSYVVADDSNLRVVADFRGNQHLYCHRTEGAAGPSSRSPTICARSPAGSRSTMTWHGSFR